MIGFGGLTWSNMQLIKDHCGLVQRADRMEGVEWMGSPTREAILVAGFKNGGLNSRGDGGRWMNLRDLRGKWTEHGDG